MSEIVTIIRSMLVIIPAILGTIFFPLAWVIANVVALIYLMCGWIGITLIRLMGIPFIIVGMVFSNDVSMDIYFERWGASYNVLGERASAMISDWKFGDFYRKLAIWVENPKDGDLGAWIAIWNIVAAIAVICYTFEAARVVVLVIVVLIIGIFVWAGS